MRNYQFRAWDKQRNEWYGTSDNSSGTFYDFAIFGECTAMCFPRLADLQHLVITQWTGMLDINNKRIYEGDIVYGERIDIISGDTIEMKGVVEYENIPWSCGFVIKQLTQTPSASGFYNPEGMNINWDQLEVIGNIFEDKNLIKEER